MKTINAGGIFLAKPFEMFTVGNATITLQLGDGTIVGTYEANTSYAGDMPSGITFTVVGGSIVRY